MLCASHSFVRLDWLLTRIWAHARVSQACARRIISLLRPASGRELSPCPLTTARPARLRPSASPATRALWRLQLELHFTTPVVAVELAPLGIERGAGVVKTRPRPNTLQPECTARGHVLTACLPACLSKRPCLFTKAAIRARRQFLATTSPRTDSNVRDLWGIILVRFPRRPCVLAVLLFALLFALLLALLLLPSKCVCSLGVFGAVVAVGAPAPGALGQLSPAVLGPEHHRTARQAEVGPVSCVDGTACEAVNDWRCE